MSTLTTTRMVLLGASNLTLGIETVLRISQSTVAGPIDLMAALGHGRSYGMTSRILWRELPPILECGLWSRLENRAADRTFGLITDVGNDIAYGASVDDIADWVDRCAERLAPRCERLVITELPLASLQGLGPRRFGFMRSILFPGSQLSLGDALRRAEELNDRVRRIASACGATVVAQPSDWFGFDPIHIRKRVWNLAWKKILAAWSDAPIDFAQRRSWRHWWRLRRTRPESRRIFGREQHRAQPSTILGDDIHVSFF